LQAILINITIMKNNFRNIVIFSALALLISSCAKQESENKAVNMKIKLTWTVVTNMLVGEASCRAAFTIQNKSSQTIGISVGPFIIHKFPGG